MRFRYSPKFLVRKRKKNARTEIVGQISPNFPRFLSISGVVRKQLAFFEDVMMSSEEFSPLPLLLQETIRIMIHTDPGNDIDDEIAVGYFVRYCLANIQDYNIHFTVSVKTLNVKRLIAYGIRPFAQLDLNTDCDNVISLCDSRKTLTITFHDGTVFIPDDYTPHFIACIAPGLDSVLTTSNLVDLRGFSHQV